MKYPGANDYATFCYGFDITPFNQYINFKIASLGPVLTAVLPVGNYTCTQFMAAVVAAISQVDQINTYSVTLNRNVNGGTANRMTISTSGTFLSLLFGSGPNAATSPAPLMGFTQADQVGGTMYTGTLNAGILLTPNFPTYNYNGPNNVVEQDGVKNVSATGIKETLVFAKMKFFKGMWQYITDQDGSGQLTAWQNFLQYATQQLQFEFQPSINEDPTLFYECTLESTPEDGNGMKYELKQMLQMQMYRFYGTGDLKFRIVVD